MFSSDSLALAKRALLSSASSDIAVLRDLTSTIQFGQNQGRPSMRLWRSRASCDTPMHLVCAHPSQRSQHRALLFVLTVLEHERQLILLLMGMMVGIKQSVVG